jgi:hypothetical protein
MPITIYYTKRFNKDIEQELQKEECKDALTKYNNRTFRSLNIHKLKNFGNNIYTMYINITDRIIFHRDQRGSINVLDVIRHHNYDNSKVKGFNIASLFENDREVFVKFSSIKEDKAEYKEDEEEDFFQNLEEESLYNGIFVTLSGFQNEAINEVGSEIIQGSSTNKLPLLISGAPGSGKTLVAREILIQYIDAKILENLYYASLDDKDLGDKKDISTAATATQLAPTSTATATQLAPTSTATALAAAPDDTDLDDDNLDASISEKQIRAYYIAPSKHLRKKMRQAISEFPDADQYSTYIKIISYEKFITRHLKISKDVANIDHFEEWLNTKKIAQLKTKLQLDVKDLYHELSIAAVMSKENYLNLGINQSSLKDKASRDLLFSLYNDYKSYLHQNNKVDLALYKMQTTENLEGSPLLILDESQTYTHCQLLNMQKIFKKNAVYLGDSNQSMMSAVSYSDYLKTLYYNKNSKTEYLNVKEWSYSYRCPEMIVGFADEIKDLKKSIFSIKNSALLGTIGNTKTGGVYTLNKEEQESIFKVRSVNLAYVVFTKKEKEALKKQNIHHIFLPEEILGLEYKHIILYNIFDIEGLKDLVKYDDDKLQKKSSETAGSNEQILLLNKLFVAITRTTNNIYIIEPNIDQTRVSPLLQHLKITEKDAVSRRTQTLDIKAITNSTNVEWFEEAISLFKQGKEDQAQQIIKYLESKLESDKISPLFNELLNISNSKQYDIFKIKYDILKQIKAIIDNDNSQLDSHIYFEGYDYSKMFNLTIQELSQKYTQENEISDEEKQFINFLISKKDTNNSFMEIICSKFDLSTSIEKYIFDTYLKNKIKAELLSSAVDHNNESLANLLIAAPYNTNPSEALYFAVKRKDNKAIERLIQTYNADPSEALYFAVIHSDYDEIGVRLINNYKSNPLEAYCFAIIRDKQNILEILEDKHNINVIEAYCFAIMQNKQNILEILEDKHQVTIIEVINLSFKKKNIDLIIQLCNKNLTTPLTLLDFAIINNFIDAIAFMVDNNFINPLDVLYHTINNKNHNNLVMDLIKSGVVNPLEALDIAITYNKLELIIELIKNKLITIQDIILVNNHNKAGLVTSLINNNLADINEVFYLTLEHDNRNIAAELINSNLVYQHIILDNAILQNKLNIIIGILISNQTYTANVLNFAIKNDKVSIVTELVRNKLVNEYTAIELAILDNKVEIVTKLVKTKLVDEYTALEVAIWNNKAEIVTELVKNKLDSKLYALEVAIRNDKVDIITKLVNNKLVSLSNALEVAIRNNKYDKISKLFNHYKLSEALYFAMKYNNEELISKLQEKKFNPSEVLYFAIKHKDENIIPKLQNPPYKANLSEALYFAIKNKDNNIIPEIKKQPYNADLSEALYFALIEDYELAKTMITSYSAKPLEALNLAIMRENMDVILKLINYSTRRVFLPSALKLAIKNDNLEIVVGLINEKLVEKLDALHDAIIHDNLKIVVGLINRDLVEKLDALHDAIIHDNLEIVVGLINKELVSESEALISAIINDAQNIVVGLINRELVSETKALRFAMEHNFIDIIKLLIDNNFFNIGDVIEIAISYDYSYIATQLINEGLVDKSEALLFALRNVDDNNKLNHIVASYNINNNLLSSVRQLAENDQHVLEMINEIESKIQGQRSEDANPTPSHASAVAGERAAQAGNRFSRQ